MIFLFINEFLIIFFFFNILPIIIFIHLSKQNNIFVLIFISYAFTVQNNAVPWSSGRGWGGSTPRAEGGKGSPLWSLTLWLFEPLHTSFVSHTPLIIAPHTFQLTPLASQLNNTLNIIRSSSSGRLIPPPSKG